MKPINTFIIAPPTEQFILPCLRSIRENSGPEHLIYLVDQTKEGIRNPEVYSLIDLYIRRPMKAHWGFAAANNLGIREVKTKYFTLCNDDVEFMDKRWWDGVLYTFDMVKKQTPSRPAIIVNPSSARLPAWSVAKDGPDGEPVSRKIDEDHDIVPYQKWTPEVYDFLLKNKHQIHKNFAIAPETVLDGITLYCSVFDKALADRVGLIDERFYPGGGEDYDYACRAGMAGFRTVGTTLSWVWHWWGRSFSQQDKPEFPPENRERWNNNDEKWNKDGFKFDVYGVRCRKCGETMRENKSTGVAGCPKQCEGEFYEMPKIMEVE